MKKIFEQLKSKLVKDEIQKAQDLNFEIQEVLSICNEILQIPSVTTYEKPFLKYIEKFAKKYKFEIKKTNKYIVIKPKGINPKVLISAHIDRHGLKKNWDNQLEYINYWLRKYYNLKFRRLDKDFYENTGNRHTRETIISYEGIEYTTTRYNLDHKKKLVTYDTNKPTLPNERIFMFKSHIKFNGDKFMGQIDNAISVAVLLYLIKTKQTNQEIIFTTQEEIGKSWENVVHYLEKSKKNLPIITIDTSPYENFNNKKLGFLTLRKGDENGKFDLKTVKEIEIICKRMKIPTDYKSSTNGMTELGRISTQSKNKYNGATLQIPTMNYHTTYETATLESLENYIKVLKELNN